MPISYIIMSHLWTLANHTPDNLNLIIEELKEENKDLKQLIKSWQAICDNLNEQIKKLEDKIKLQLEMRDHRRRASP